MAKRGRPGKPTALKLLQGDRADRINRAEPLMPTGSVEPPGWLEGYAAEQWAELAPILSRTGLLTEGDRPALAMLCQTYDAYRRNPADTKILESYRRLLVEFGLTPSARSRLKTTVEKPKDALEEFLAG
jgi:phage terminase small subunit